MAFDGFFCVALANELNAWVGARVDKLNFCSASSLCLSLYRQGSRSFLLISASAAKPIISLSDNEPLRPEQPAGLTMLFRKHLINARLTSVTCVKNERIIRFEFDSADEMGYVEKRYIYAEMMGKYSNIVLCNQENRILGASSVADITASVRQVMAGMPYELPPPQSKTELSYLAMDKQAFFALMEQNNDKRADAFLLSGIFSLSPLIARELVYIACGKTDAPVYGIDKERLYNQIKELYDLTENRLFTPVMIRGRDGQGVEYSYMPITQYGAAAVCEQKESFSALLTEFFGKKEENANIRKHAADILRVVNSAMARLRRKVLLQREELEECKKREDYKKEGDLITANLYRLKQGDSIVSLYDYENEREISLALDTRLSPAKNAQNRYKKYTKFKHAETVLNEQIKKAENEINYLESVYDFIMRSSNIAELNEIRSELAETGYIAKKNDGKKQKSSPQKPLIYTTANGLTVRAGRNNKDNDTLTAAADKWDIWFHIKGFHGSHVILYTNGDEPDAQDYTEAARIAAYHSEKRGSENVGVDYTQVKHLKKPGGSAPGFITYDKYWTAFVDATLPEKNKE